MRLDLLSLLGGGTVGRLGIGDEGVCGGMHRRASVADPERRADVLDGFRVDLEGRARTRVATSLFGFVAVQQPFGVGKQQRLELSVGARGRAKPQLLGVICKLQDDALEAASHVIALQDLAQVGIRQAVSVAPRQQRPIFCGQPCSGCSKQVPGHLEPLLRSVRGLWGAPFAQTDVTALADRAHLVQRQGVRGTSQVRFKDLGRLCTVAVSGDASVDLLHQPVVAGLRDAQPVLDLSAVLLVKLVPGFRFTASASLQEISYLPTVVAAHSRLPPTAAAHAYPLSLSWGALHARFSSALSTSLSGPFVGYGIDLPKSDKLG